MTKTTGELKLEARESLSGKRFASAVFLIFCMALIYLVNYAVSYFSLKAEAYDIVTTCVYVFLGYPFFAVVIKYFLVLSRGEKKKLSKIFSPFDRSYMTLVYFAFTIFAAGYAVNFLLRLEFSDSAVVTMLSALKWVIYVLSYIFAIFGACVIADNTDLDFRSFLNLTGRYIKSGSVKLLALTLSFLGWFLLCIVTFGIALFRVLPYFVVTVAKLYDSFTEEEYEETEQKSEEEPEIEEPETKEAEEDSVTRDLSEPVPEKELSPDETVVFTKEMLEKIKNSGKID